MMKNNYTLTFSLRRIISVLFFSCLVYIGATAQVANYAFSQFNGTYSPLIGGTVLGSSPTFNDDNNYPLQNIGFTFNYNGVPYTQIGISDNGYICLGAITNTWYGNVLQFQTNTISPFNADLLGNSATHQLSYQTSGSPGSQVMTIEWFHYGFYSSGLDEFNVQIKLYEADGAIEFIYDPVAASTTRLEEVGLNGTPVTDFNNRTTTTDWTATTAGLTNAATCSFSSTIVPPSGLTFHWVLAPIDMAPVALATPLPNTCYTASETVTIRIKNFGSSIIDFSVNPVTVSASSTGTNPQVFAPVIVNSGTLAVSATLDVVVSNSYNMSAQGIYTFIANTSVTGDGNPGNDNMAPVSLPVYPPVNATASPASLCLGSSAQLSTPPGQVGYSVAPITFAPLACTGTTVTLSDDQLSAALPIGFTFNFFGINKTQFYISSNGFVSFDPLAGSGCCTGQILPNPATPNDLIALAWEDLYPPAGGTISYYTTGSSPFRQLVVCFTGIMHYPSPGNNPLTGQIIFNESSNTIELHIASFNTDGDGVGETQGIENANGTIAVVVPGRNGVDPWSETNEGWLFTPSSPFTFIWNPSTWLDNSAIYNPILTPLAIGPFTYTVTATDPSSGCTSTSSVTVTVVAVPSAPLSSNVTQCGTGAATLTATAVGGGTLQWFDQPTGGPMLGTGTTFITPVISATTNYYVEEYDGNCSGPRTTVTVTITPPTSVSISPSQPAICGAPASTTITLTASSTNLSYTYTWTGNDLNSTTGPSVTATPLATNTYIVFATDGSCSTTDTITIPLTPNPVANATANPNPVCQGQPSQLNTPPGQVTYTVAPIAYAPLACTGTTVTLGDDQLSAALPIGFTFNFYGIDKTQFHISSNGFISFDPAAGSGCCTGQVLPNTFSPNDLIALAWEDFYPPFGGTISYYTTGSAPSRKLVVCYTGIGHYSNGNNPLTGQIILNESANTIEIHITSFSTDGDGFAGETQGIENATGTVATAVPGRNSTDPWPGQPIVNDAWIFTPISPYSFTWNPTTWLSSTTVYNPALTALSTGNFTYNVTVTDVTSGCTSTSSVTVNVVPVPSAPISANITRCGTGMITLTATAGGPGTLQWWDAPTGGNMVGTGSPLTLGPISSSTTYYVEEFDGACPGPRTAVIVTVTAADTVTVASTANPMCAGNPVTLTMSSINTTYSYTWSPATGLSSTTGNSVTANPPFSITYTINAIDGAGCESSTTINLTVNPSPVIIAPSATPSTVCAGSNSQLDVSYVLPPTNYIISSVPYSPLPAPTTNAVLIPTGFWVAGDEGLTAPINLGFSFSFFGNTYSTVSINSNGHLQFTPYPALNTYAPFNPLPDGFTPDNIIALLWGDLDQSAGGTITYGTVGTAPNRKFVVQFTNVVFYPNNGTLTSQAILSEGTNCIEVHVTNVNSTSFLSTVIGIENSTGTVGFAPPGRNTGIWNVSTPEAWQFCPQIPYNFSWTPSATLNDSTISNPVASPTSTTTYTVSITDPTFNCTSTASVTVNAYPLPVVTLASLSNVCIDGSPLPLSGGTPAGGTFSGTGVSNNTFYPSVAGIGTFTIYYTFTDNNGCSGTDSSQIVVNALPIVTMPTFPVVCATSYPVNLNTGAPVGGIYSGPGVSANMFDPSVTGDGVFGITYTYTDGNGCTNSALRNIIVNQSPVANAGPDILGNNALNGSASGGTPPYTYVWYPCLNLSNCNTPNPVATPPVNTNYVLVVIDANGCYSSDTVYVTSTVGIGTVASQNTDFLIYPNPSSGVYNILFINASEKTEITITDIIGQQVFSSGSITAPSLPYAVNLSTQPNGIYLMQVKYKDRIFTSRLILNK